MTSEEAKFVISVGMPSFLVLAGILNNPVRLSGLRRNLEKRFDDLGRVIQR
jgi:hypothetical protein